MSRNSGAFTGNITPDYIGAMCANFRRYYTKCTQNDVAVDVGCSREMVSKFERGKTVNSIIFLWYIQKGIFDWVPWDKWNGWMGL